jgi:hypothetical protein
MKASELIRELEKAIREHGDLDVIVNGNSYESEAGIATEVVKSKDLYTAENGDWIKETLHIEVL